MNIFAEDEKINVVVGLVRGKEESRQLVLRPTDVEVEYEVVEWLNGDVDFAYRLSRKKAVVKFNSLLLQYGKEGWEVSKL